MEFGLADRLRLLLRGGAQVAHVTVARASGSTPREAGVAMLVTDALVFGTVGGGRLEWDAVARARALLAEGGARAALDIPLGPAIGQCCGGHVSLVIERAGAGLLARIEDAERAAAAAYPCVLLFGAGHVGRALAAALAPLPLRVRWIDGRAEAFGEAPRAVAAIVSDAWEQEIAAAPAGSACMVLTHSHALDSLIVAAALARDDLAYVGLIGSHTKRRQFERAFRDIGIAPARIARLVCPIGGGFARDKRPAVIAAFAAAELLDAALTYSANLSRAPSSPSSPRRNASTQATNTNPCATVTHAPSGAR